LKWRDSLVKKENFEKLVWSMFSFLGKEKHKISYAKHCLTATIENIPRSI